MVGQASSTTKALFLDILSDGDDIREQFSCAPLNLSNLQFPQSTDEEFLWGSGWYTIKDIVRGAPACQQPDLVRMPDSDQFIIFYEYRGENNQWHIGYSMCDNILGPYTDQTYPLFSPSGDAGCPAETGIADPSVLYLEDADVPWHMWFDMRDRNGVWRIGHATSSDGLDWEIQRNTDGKPQTVIDVGNDGEWDDDFVHAPEAFVYDGEVRLVYNAQGTGHHKYDGGIAVADDEDGVGYSFTKIGQTTFGDTAVGGRDIRVKKPIEIDDAFYAIHGRDTGHHATVCKSTDGCENWEIVSQFPYHCGNSFLIYDDYIFCISSDASLHVKKAPI